MNAYHGIKFYTPLQIAGQIATITGTATALFLLLCFG